MKFITLFIILLALAITACDSKKSSPQVSESSPQGSTSGGGNYITSVGMLFLEKAKEELAEQIDLLGDEVFTELPEGWSQERIIKIIQNVQVKADSAVTRDKIPLSFDYSLEKDEIYALKYAFVKFGASDIDFFFEDERERFVEEFKIGILHELGHLMGIGKNKKLNWNSRYFAKFFLKVIDTYHFQCSVTTMTGEVPLVWQIPMLSNMFEKNFDLNDVNLDEFVQAQQELRITQSDLIFLIKPSGVFTLKSLKETLDDQEPTWLTLNQRSQEVGSYSIGQSPYYDEFYHYHEKNQYESDYSGVVPLTLIKNPNEYENYIYLGMTTQANQYKNPNSRLKYKRSDADNIESFKITRNIDKPIIKEEVDYIRNFLDQQLDIQQALEVFNIVKTNNRFTGSFTYDYKLTFTSKAEGAQQIGQSGELNLSCKTVTEKLNIDLFLADEAITNSQFDKYMVEKFDTDIEL